MKTEWSVVVNEFDVFSSENRIFQNGQKAELYAKQTGGELSVWRQPFKEWKVVKAATRLAF